MATIPDVSSPGRLSHRNFVLGVAGILAGALISFVYRIFRRLQSKK